MGKSTTPQCLLAITGAFHTDGGIAALNRLTIRAVVEAGYQAHVYALVETEAAIDERYGQKRQLTYRVFGRDKITFTLALWRALLSQTYNYVLIDHVNLGAALAPLAWLGRCRYAIWLCGMEVFPPRPDLEGRLGLGFAWRRLAISRYTQKSVMERFPNLSVTVCDLALDPGRYGVTFPEPPAESSSIPLKAVNGATRTLGQQVILHVGRMASQERHKGQDSLLQAFPAVCARFPNAQLVLAGEGDDMPQILVRAKELSASLQRQVFMPGYVPDDLLKRLYQTCYLFAMPSTGEGFGLVYLEAMIHAKPCLGGRVDATPYVVHDGVTGVLVDDPRSADQVAEKIIWLLDNPESAHTMGQAGYDLARSYYLFPHFKERFWAALQTA